MWGPDVSIYQSLQTDYKAMKANGATFAIARSGQSTSFYDANLEGHASAIRAAGLKFGMYHWFDPNVSAQAQVDYFAKKVTALKPDFICPDFEQWWKSWAEWQNAVNGTITWDKVTRTDPNLISSTYHTIDTLLHNMGIVLDYTGMWFMSNYAPNMYTWIAPNFKWYADYTFIYKYYGTTSAVTRTWEQFQTLLAALVSPDCDIHQFGSTVIIPATPGKTDLNIVRTQNVDLLRVLGAETTPILTLEMLNNKIIELDRRLGRIESLPWYHQFFPVVEKENEP